MSKEIQEKYLAKMKDLANILDIGLMLTGVSVCRRRENLFTVFPRRLLFTTSRTIHA